MAAAVLPLLVSSESVAAPTAQPAPAVAAVHLPDVFTGSLTASRRSISYGATVTAVTRPAITVAP